jgi:hypothetical protein
MWVQFSRPMRIPIVALGRYRRFREEALLTMVEQLEQEIARRSPACLASS